MFYIQLNKYKLSILTLVIILMSLGVQSKEERTILILGDSIGAGYGIPSENRWTNILQDLIDSTNTRVNVINANISGDTTQGGLSRVSNLLKEHSPEFLVIELGGNDALRGYPLERIKSNLLDISKIGKSYEAQIFLVQMRIPPNYGAKYTKAFENIFEEVALTAEVNLIPFMLEDIALDKNLMLPDGIHPNIHAQPLIAKHFFSHLRPIIESNSQIYRKK